MALPHEPHRVKTTLIISDTHLGRRGHVRHPPTADELEPLIRSGCQRLIVNGDTAEMHHPQMRAEAARQVLRLSDLCDEAEVELTLLSGNHDPHLTDLRHLWLGGRQIFLTHGDALHPEVAPWAEEADTYRLAVAQALATLDPEDRCRLEHKLHAYQHAAHVAWLDIDRHMHRHHPVVDLLTRPWAVPRMLRYWLMMPTLAERFIAEHALACRFFLFGHAHRPGLWRRRGRVIINTGSFSTPGRPRAVVLTNHQLAYHHVRRTRRGYELVHPPRQTFTLDA